MMHRRWVRLVLALLCVPLVVFGNPGTASAATSGLLRFHFDGLGVKDVQVSYTDCQVSWARSETGMVVSPKSRCDGAPDTTPGTCQSFEAGCGSWGFVVKDPSGGTCGSTPLDAIEAPDDSIASVRIILTGGFVPLADPNCVPAEACLSYYWDGFGPGANDVVECAPIDVDPIENPTSECEYGLPSFSTRWVEVEPENDYVSRWELRVKMDGVNEGTGSGASAKGWNFGFWVVDNAVSGPYHFTNAFQYESWANPKVYTFRVSRKPDGTSEKPDWQVWGAEAYYIPGADAPEEDPTSWNYAIGQSQHSAQGTYAGYEIPRDRGYSFGGLTDPGRCRFYFGKQLVEIPGTDMDIPGGGINDPDVDPNPEPPEVDEPPVPENPDPESTNWLYLIYLVLTKILTSIIGLASNIVSGIINGLQQAFTTMFVPTKDSWKVDGLTTQLQTKPPFSIAVEMADQGEAIASSYQSAGGCPTFITIRRTSASVDCTDVRDGQGMLYGLATWGIIGSTLLGMFYRAASLFRLGQ